MLDSSGSEPADMIQVPPNHVREIFTEQLGNGTNSAFDETGIVVAKTLGPHSKFGEEITLIRSNRNAFPTLVRHCNLHVRCPDELSANDVTRAAAEKLLRQYVLKSGLRVQVNFGRCET